MLAELGPMIAMKLFLQSDFNSICIVYSNKETLKIATFEL